MNETKPNYPVNVKVPQLYVDIIDFNLKDGRPLRGAGFEGRAHFVREAVKEKLMKLGLLTQEDEERLEEARRSRI
jgi:hypothetical protein